jgi:hypothetical protein
MGGESRYLTNNPSKQIVIPTRRDFCIDSKKKYASVAPLMGAQNRPRSLDLHISYLDSPELHLVYGQKDSSNKLASWFVTGFTNAEGCFGLYIYKNTNYKTN